MAFVWEQRKFVEFVKNAAKKNKDNIDLEPYAVTNDRGFIAQKDAHDDFGYMSNVDRTAYNIVPPNSFAYNPARINVGSLGYYEGTENVIVSSLYEVFQTEEYIDDKFLLHWFKSDSFPRWIEKLQEGSVRLYFYFDKLVQCQMMVPSLEEQKRISAYLDSIDQLITLHQRKRMLRRCFFSIDWEQRKLGEVAKYRNGKAHENCIDDDGKYIVVNSKFVSTNGKVKKFSNMQNEPLFENEVAFVLSDVPNGRAIARTFLVEKSDKYTLNQRIAGITPLNETDPYYLHVLMNRHPYFLAFDDGVKQTNLSVSDVMKFESYYPKYEEQETIGRCFSQLDQLITLHQCKSNFCKKNEVNAWEQRKVSEIADRFDNLRVPVAANLRTPGTTPYYGANGIQDYVEGYTHDGEFVLVAEDGANDLKNYPVKCVNGRIWVNNHAHVLQARPQIASNQFLAYSMSQANIEALLVGGGRAKLNAEVMMGIVLRIPRLQEQEVIGGYFYKLDQLITLHQWECNINENTEGNDEKQRKPIKKLIISEGNLSLVDDMFLLHRMTFLVCNKYILLRLNVVKYKITIIIISNILYSIVSLLIIACYLIVINKQLIILIYVEISVVIIKGDDDYARIRS